MGSKKQQFDAMYSEFAELQKAYKDLEKNKILETSALKQKLIEAEKQRQFTFNQSTDLLDREEQLLRRENELFDEEERIMKLQAQLLEGKMRERSLSSKTESVSDGAKVETRLLDKSTDTTQISTLKNKLADKEAELEMAQSQFEESVDQIARFKKILERQQDEIVHLRLQKDAIHKDTKETENIMQIHTFNEIEAEKSTLKREIDRLRKLISMAEETILPLANNTEIQPSASNAELLRKARLTEARLAGVESKFGNLHFSQMVEQCAKMVRSKLNTIKI